MDCPNCKLVNPSTAERCDCGYDFNSHTVQQSYLTERDRQLSKPLMTGTVVLTLLAVRFALVLARGAQDVSPLALLLVLLALASVLGVWLFRRQA